MSDVRVERWHPGDGDLTERRLMRAMELNGVQVDNNKAAFEWGRRCAHDLASVTALFKAAQVIEFVKKPSLDDFVGVADHRLERRNHVADHIFGRIVQQHREAAAALQSGRALVGQRLDEQRMLRDREDVRAACLSIPARHARKPVRDHSGRANPGFLRAEDLALYAGAVESPVSAGYRGATVWKCGPWTQGPVFLQMLRLLEGFLRSLVAIAGIKGR